MSAKWPIETITKRGIYVKNIIKRQTCEENAMTDNFC